MSQGSLNVPTVGPDPPTNFAGQINTALDAIITKNSAATAPNNFPTTGGGTTIGQDWLDTSPAGYLDLRMNDGTNFVYRESFDTTNHVVVRKIGGGTVTTVNFVGGVVDLTAHRETYIKIANTNLNLPITGFGSGALGVVGETKWCEATTQGRITFNATSMILPGGQSITFNIGDTWQMIYLGGGNWRMFDFSPGSIPFNNSGQGQCRLILSGGNLVLMPYNGNQIWIDGWQTIPDAGVSLAPPASNNVVYYVFAQMVAGVMQLNTATQISGVTYAPLAGQGQMVRSPPQGNTNQTLVGMAMTRTNAWADAPLTRFVRSWFNDPGINMLAPISSGGSTNSTIYVDVLPARAEFLIWAGESALFSFNGPVVGSAVNTIFNATLAIAITVGGNPTPDDSFQQGEYYQNGVALPCALDLFKSGLAEGYNAATLMAFVSNVAAASITFTASGSAGSRGVLRGFAKR